MTINIVNPFKSQTTKTFDKSKIGRDVHASEYPPADVSLYSGKRIFKFGTATTVVDDNLSKAKPLERVKAVQFSSLFDVCADTRVEKQKKILSKVKSAKDNISKLFKSTGRVSEAIPCIDSFAIPSVEHSPTNDHSSSPTPSFIAQHAEPTAHVVTAYESIPPRNTSLEIIASPIAFDENAVDEHIEGLASTFCNLVETSFPPPAVQLFTTLEFRLAGIPSALFLDGLHTIEEEDENTQVVVGVTRAQQKELATPDSYVSQSDSDSEVTVYLSSDTLSDYSTPHGAGSVGLETSTSPVDTSFATSVDAEDSHQLVPGALRGLHRVPSYEDLRNPHIIAHRASSPSDMSCGSSDCDFLYGAASGINATPLRRPMKCDNLRELFLLFEPKIHTPSTRQMNKYKKLREWLSTRCHESSRSTQKTSTSRAPSKPQKVTSVSRGRQFFQSICHPSSRVQAHVSKPSSHYPPPPSSPPVWSCAKITRSSSKTKKRRRMTKQAMRELKARLDSMDIDPWY